MEKELKVVPSEELSYWIGVAQSDGCLTSYLVKRDKFIEKKEIRVELSLDVCYKSLPMLKKFRDLSKTIFGRDSQIWKTAREYWKFHIAVKSLLPLFKGLDIVLSSKFFIPPYWVVQEPKYFGAYLAGLIDGDGDIAVKRPKYPQCAVTISSGAFQDILAESITKILGCGVHQAKYHKISLIKSSDHTIEGTWYRLAFYVSSKTTRFILDFVLPYIQLTYKKKIICDFIVKRYGLLI